MTIEEATSTEMLNAALNKEYMRGHKDGQLARDLHGINSSPWRDGYAAGRAEKVPLDLLASRQATLLGLWGAAMALLVFISIVVAMR